MKYTVVLTAICSTLAAALPAQVEERQAYAPCPGGFYSTPRCCEADAVGVDIDCHTPSSTPTDAANFRSICENRVPRCCIPNILGSDMEGGQALCTAALT